MQGNMKIGYVLACALLAACGEPKPPEKTVFDPQVQALKKAREAEQKIQQGAERQREAVEAAGGANPDPYSK